MIDGHDYLVDARRPSVTLEDDGAQRGALIGEVGKGLHHVPSRGAGRSARGLVTLDVEVDGEHCVSHGQPRFGLRSDFHGRLRPTAF